MKDDKMTLRCFEPIVDNNSRALILGSMPGNESLARGEYYANKHNCFWRMICDLFGSKYELSYAEKKELVLRNRIALWDSAKECSRDGSQDVNIRDVVPNDFQNFFNKYTGIAYVFFNGKGSREIFEKKVKLEARTLSRLSFKQLPSTSPAYAAMRYPKKMVEWNAVKVAVSSLQR